jgi:hypothetical protein
MMQYKTQEQINNELRLLDTKFICTTLKATALLLLI